jgi:UDP-2,3-diacylglucosamine hydrolase
MVNITGDYHEANHFGKKILLTHGDGLRKDDRGYRFIKKLFRNRFCIWLYSQLPTNFAYRLAMGTSKASRSYTNNRDIKDSTDYIEFAKTKIENNYDAVIMGHVHKPEIVEINKKHYVNCGDFFTNFSYVSLNDNGFELKYMKK